MLTYLLIIFVIALALAPLSHFVPSKRQRAIAKMREYAAVQGLFVEFRQVPGREQGRMRTRDGGGKNTIYYGKRLPPAKEKREQTRAWLYENDTWTGLERRLPVPDALAHLPVSVLAASVDEGSCGIYWQEAGAVADVEQIRQVLEAWSVDLRN